jgi:hypothetical protein
MLGVMTTLSPKRTTSHAEAAILPWLFLKGGRALMCEIRVSVEVDGRHAHEVCVVPHWDVSSSVIERCDGMADAFRRHAAVAAALRQEGWILIRESVPAAHPRNAARL